MGLCASLVCAMSGNEFSPNFEESGRSSTDCVHHWFVLRSGNEIFSNFEGSGLAQLVGEWIYKPNI